MQRISWWVKSRRAQSDQDYETWLGGGVAPTLNIMDNTGDKRATVVVAIQGNAIGRQPQHGPGGKGYSEEGDPMFTLTKLDQHGVATPATVRRLTPTECERLQGFPDGWTTHRIDEKKGLVEQADSARYKQMGNAVAVPVVEWIMARLVDVDNG